ncbi:MAG: SDR family NAD(P)-dependent oxidoreductase [Polymorphobacter sp.]|uniref:SDR family NAD(P)-dependent oxidoreductase n=1 Tax=Polymorphobacter sp. TaxID=1909290 RepID=UPI003A8356C5
MSGKRNETAIVTGGAKRIGEALVRALAEDGWDLVIHYNSSRDDADKLAAELRAGGTRVETVAANLAEPDVGQRVVAAAEGLAPLGLLVNCASRFVHDRVEDFTSAEFDRHMAVNLRAPALLTQAFARALAPGRGEDGQEAALVVNLLDAKLESLNPDHFTYTLSKIALDGMTEMVARSYAPAIRAVGIAPAVTLVWGPHSREDFEAVHGLNPLRRGVAVEEIVAALRFIIATPTYNAQTIVLDGGQRLMGLQRDVSFMVKA